MQIHTFISFILISQALNSIFLPRLRILPLLLSKLQTNAIHTMPLIRRRGISLALEHMPQMAPTFTAHDLRPRHPKRAIRMPRHSARNAVEIRRPPAAGLELVRRFVEGCIASSAILS